MASQTEIEQRVKEIANDIYNDVPRAEILRKVSESFGISERQVENYYAKAQEFIREKLQGNSSIENSISLIQSAVPKAIATLVDALEILDGNERPSTLAVRAAGEILKKGLPDELRIVKIDTESVEKLKTMFDVNCEKHDIPA